jgi:cytochrome c551/c552
VFCNMNHFGLACLLVVFAILGAVVAGCAAPRDDTARAARALNLTEQADSPDALPGQRLPPGTALGGGRLPIRSVAEEERVTLSASAKRGKKLLHGHGCLCCHRINSQGGTVGPDLSNEADQGRSREWLAVQIRAPGVHNPQTIMPAFDTLSDERVENLGDYLLSLSTDED